MTATSWLWYAVAMSNELPSVPITRWYCIKYGAKWGRWLAWGFAGVLSFALAQTEFPLLEDFTKNLAGFLLFWFYGFIVGGIVGTVLGALTGYLIFTALRCLRWRYPRQGWLVGLFICTAVCACLWLILFTLSSQWSCTTAQCNQGGLAALAIIFYPGMIYILAGAVLSQRIYARMHSQREGLRTYKW